MQTQTLTSAFLCIAITEFLAGLATMSRAQWNGWLTVNELDGLLKDNSLVFPWSEDNHEHTIATCIHAEIQIPNLQSTNNGKLLHRDVLPTTSSQTSSRHKNSVITPLYNIYGNNSSTCLRLVITHLHFGVHFISDKYG